MRVEVDDHFAQSQSMMSGCPPIPSEVRPAVREALYIPEGLYRGAWGDACAGRRLRGRRLFL